MPRVQNRRPGNGRECLKNRALLLEGVAYCLPPCIYLEGACLSLSLQSLLGGGSRGAGREKTDPEEFVGQCVRMLVCVCVLLCCMYTQPACSHFTRARACVCVCMCVYVCVLRKREREREDSRLLRNSWVKKRKPSRLRLFDEST